MGNFRKYTTGDTPVTSCKGLSLYDLSASVRLRPGQRHGALVPPGANVASRPRGADVRALRAVAAEPFEPSQDIVVLDAFGDDAQPEIVREIDGRSDDDIVGAS